jgi:hypothetical protein
MSDRPYVVVAMTGNSLHSARFATKKAAAAAAEFWSIHGAAAVLWDDPLPEVTA